MKTEVEAKFLNIDPDVIRDKLKTIGATLIFSESMTTQKIFDFPDYRLDKDISWLRLREEDKTTILTFKKWEKEGIEGMKEIEFKVDSFTKAEELLVSIGMVVKSFQMKKRELWRFDDVEFMIDTWPWIPTFIEIEGSSEESVRAVANRLGFLWEKAVFGGVAVIYKKYFDIDYKEIDRCPEIVFSSIPEWLEKKRILKN
jgi:adenylate cyclase class 2